METRTEKREPLGERLLKGLQEANEWARGERDDLRVTVASSPAEEANVSSTPSKARKAAKPPSAG